MHVQIIDTTPEHIRTLGVNLRSGDREEIEAYGFPTSKALWRSYKNSILRKTALVDGEVAACWGVGGVLMGGVGQPFLMTTSAAERVSPLRFVRIYQEEVLKMLQLFPVLVNWVDPMYTKAMRLLDIIGFEISAPEPLGLLGKPFCKFEMRA